MRYFKIIKMITSLLIIILLAVGFDLISKPIIASDYSDYEEFFISTAEELNLIAKFISRGNTGEGCYYKLTSDIDLAELGDLDGIGWPSIGTDSRPFYGIFDGAGYTIKNLWINRPDDIEGAGFFGGNAGTIKNLNISIDETKDGINAKYYAGAIAGINTGTIENCTAIGSVAAESQVGGICGQNKGIILNSTNMTDITGDEGVGGIVGENTGEIRLCQNIGTIKGRSDASCLIGGIAGHCPTGNGISQSANYGTISVGSWIGGITGYAQFVQISACKNSGEIFGNNSAGGIVGRLSTQAKINGCLNTGVVMANDNVGGIAGAVSGKITNSYYDITTVNNSLVQNVNDDIECGTPLTENEFITRKFLAQLNIGIEYWFLRTPTDYHYYPELIGFNEDELSAQYAKSKIAVYKGIAQLNTNTLTYGETLSTITFAEDAMGLFFWQNPERVLKAGVNVAYASFVPFNGNYGEQYDIEIILTVNKASSSLTATIDNWKAGQEVSMATITIISGERTESELIIEYKRKGASDSEYTTSLPTKFGKYLVRVSYLESDNYLATYFEYEFKVTPDLAWLYTLVSVICILLVLYLTNKKYHYLTSIKKVFAGKVIMQEVIVEKPIYIEPEINTLALDDYTDKLTPREQEVAKRILEGKTRMKIAEELNISEATAKRHIESILKKTDCANQKIFVIKFKK